MLLSGSSYFSIKNSGDIFKECGDSARIRPALYWHGIPDRFDHSYHLVPLRCIRNGLRNAAAVDGLAAGIDAPQHDAVRPVFCFTQGNIKDVSQEVILINQQRIISRLREAGIQPVVQSVLLVHNNAALNARIWNLNTVLTVCGTGDRLARSEPRTDGQQRTESPIHD